MFVVASVHALQALGRGNGPVCCASPPRGSVAMTAHEAAARRRLRWEAAAATLEATTEARSRFDHRARLASLIGIYMDEDGSKVELLVAMQPDKGGRKLLFLDAVAGDTMGVIELETQWSPHEDHANPVGAPGGGGGGGSSALRGMLVDERYRGQGHARLFLAIWLRLCLRGGVPTATTRINKPLLALTLVRLGFTPQRGQRLAALTNEQHLRGARGTGGAKGRRPKARQRPLAVEVSQGSEGRVVLFCPQPTETERLQAGFTATELRSQRLQVVTEPPEPRGRVAHIRVRYAPPRARDTEVGHDDDVGATGVARPRGEGPSHQLVHAPLALGALGDRLRLSTTQGPASGAPSDVERAEMIRLLIGRLEHPAHRRPADEPPWPVAGTI